MILIFHFYTGFLGVFSGLEQQTLYFPLLFFCGLFCTPSLPMLRQVCLIFICFLACFCCFCIIEYYNELFVDISYRRHIKVLFKAQMITIHRDEEQTAKNDHLNVLYAVVHCLSRGGETNYYLKHFSKASQLVVLLLRSYKLYAIKITSKCALF